MVSDQDFSKMRDRVIQLEGQIRFLYKHLGVEFVAESAPQDDPKIIEALKKGNLLEAIKVYRTIHNVDYETGKAGVEEIKGRLGI